MVNDYKIWFDEALEYVDDIRDDDELYRITRLAENIGVAVDQELVDQASSIIAERPPHYDEGERDAFEHSFSSAGTRDDGHTIEALFGRLGEN